MYDLPKNTIFSYLSNPLFDKLDFSSLPVSMLAEEIKKFSNKNPTQVAPETEALKFYFLNHAFHTMKSKFNPLENLDENMTSVAEKHIKITNQVAKRLFFYSIIICVEEARFMSPQSPEFYNFMDGSYGSEFVEYMNNDFSTKNDRSLTSFGELDMTCGDFARAMVSVFAFGKWQPGFGGKGWTPIASLASQAINGEISFESMADQAFSLCHNNGSMFNKGHMYQHYSDFIYSILDIQDSGQIPQWINTHLSNRYVDKELKDIFQIVKTHFPEEMSGSVNQSLISASAKKREKKAAQLAAQYHHNWNNWNNQQTQSAITAKQNAVLQKQKAQNDVLLAGLNIKPKV